MGDRWGAAFVRIGWQASFGLGGSFAPDWVAGITGIRTLAHVRVTRDMPAPVDGVQIALGPLLGKGEERGRLEGKPGERRHQSIRSGNADLPTARIRDIGEAASDQVKERSSRE